MKAIRKLKFLLVLFLLGWANVTQAHVYWKPSSGNDSNDGSTGAKAVKTWTRAIALLSSQDNNAQIYLCERLTISSTTTMDGAISGRVNARVRRNMTDYMFVVNSGVTLTLKNITITGEMHSSNPHWSDTKSIIATSGVVVLDDGTVLRDNYVTADAEPYAGAVRVYHNGTLTMKTGSLISNCRAERSGSEVSYMGGAIMSGGSCTVNIYGGTIENCYAADLGGAICLRGGNYTFNMTGGTIRNCFANIYGGGINISDWTSESSANVNITGGVIDNCSTHNSGGGIYMNCGRESTFIFDGGEVKNCSTYVMGAGIYILNANTTARLKSGSIHHCTSAGSGEGDNLGRGAGIAFRSCIAYIEGDNMEIHHNHCKCYGGGVQVDTDAILHFSKGKIHHNTAGDDYNHTPQYGAAGIHVTSAVLDMTGGEIYENVAWELGGAVHCSYEGVMEVKGGKIYNNVAGMKGGGFHINTQTTLKFPVGSTVEMYGNVASMGGAVLMDCAKLYVYDGVFHDNHAVDTIETDWANKGYGGAFCMIMYNPNDQHEGLITPASFFMYGGEVYNNTAVNDGGAVYMAKNDMFPLDGDSKITIKGGDIHHNNALTGSGGGIYSDAGSIFRMTDTLNDIGHFRYNTAQQNGGGVYLVDADFKISAGTFENNTATLDGGGFYITGDESVVVLEGGEIKNNKAYQNGGGFAVVGGNVDITQANTTYPTLITQDTAVMNGGGMYISGGLLTLTNGSVSNNAALQDGGGFYVDVANNTAVTTVRGGATIANNTAVNGAGAYVNQGQLTIQDAATNITSNTATTSGGGIYMANGTVTFTNAKMQTNTATNNDGGGLYLGNGDITISGANAAISGNMAKNRGGGVFVGGGSFDMSGGVIGGTTAQGNKTTGNGGYGGGLYMGGGTATLTGGSISGNTATEGYGGGIYMVGGTCTLSGGANIGGESTTYANNARFGGGLYSAGGAITFMGGHIDHNIATADGGGIYSNGPDATVLITKEGSALSYMLYNTAVNGGGIYANRGSVVFTDGNINYNYASQAGGGMYVNDEGTLYLKGNAVLSRNHVPSSMKGGGVYLRGTVVVGEASKTETSILAEDNFAFTTDSPETYTCDNTTRNNIYLPEPIANPYTSDIHRDVITVIENGIGANSHVGFSVPRNHVPVIYCERSETSWNYLDRFTTGPHHDLNTRLFDDTEHYLSVHYTHWPEAFDPDHVYLYGFWPEAVRSLDDVPDNGFTVDGNTVTISNKEGLAWLISYVNGLNDSDPHTSADLVVNLEADVDMKDFGWVPIGFMGNLDSISPQPFNGTFNGNGHTITGVNGMVYGQGKKGVYDYGLFGYVTGGTIQDVFVKGMEYYTDNNGDLILGGLIGENIGGVVCNSEVQSKLVSQSAQTLIGGLVGKQTDGTVHSSIGIADMTGGRMGGLIGELAGGNLYNSFANALFTSKDITMYSGGLVAINNGTVENCYARLRGDAPSGNFGILVGDNTDGEVNYCYAPAGMTNYKAAGAAPTGHGNYGDSFLPYLYRHRDTQVSLADDNDFVPSGEDVDKQMLIALNNWVNEMSTEDMAYTKWGRPWQESETNKPLNDDYPILKMPLNDAVAAESGDPYLYYGPIDTLLVKYTADEEAIWKYRTAADTVRGENNTSAAKLYIAEDVVLINRNALKAYVGITLDNSAGVNGANPTYFDVVDTTDWHMISTPLSDAPLGINYTDENTPYEFSEGHPDGMPYYCFHPKDNARHGYFPSHKYGYAYPSTDSSLDGNPGNYYHEWDFYAYYEPKYHWINFKRNSASHHIYGNEEHETIYYYGDGVNYGNEVRMIPGKGYFAATREETFLQCYGTLNNGSVEYNNLTQTAGVPRHGYNLLGNPYQAYLDFNAFAIANSSATDEEAIWYAKEAASYTIIDEDDLNTTDSVETAFGVKPVFYKTYAYQSSYNPDVSAGRFIYPHQGFFVLLRGRSNAAATFEPVMRNATDTVNSKFRGQDHLDYPLVNLFAIEENGAADVVTIELGRPDQGGAQVMQGLRTGNGKIWCHYNDEDWTIAYTQPGISEVNIRFESAEDTEYTMRWNTRNGDFSYLHLIDNMTGANIDCLSEKEYKFSSRTSDYTSRFKLVFGYTGIEEDSEAETAPTFAFMMGDEMVVNGEGVLQVFDVSGRLVTSRELHGVQSTVALPEVANGVYVLRLTEGKQSRVQKMVISK